MFEDESDLGGFQPTPHPSTVRLGLPNAEEQAYLYFQLKSRIFEEVKIPNVILNDLSDLLRRQGSGLNSSDILSIRSCEEDDLIIRTALDEKLVSSNEVTIRFKRFLSTLGNKYSEVLGCDL